MKVNISTLVGIEASCAFVKWNSEFARVVKAAHTITKLDTSVTENAELKILTFAALILADVAGGLQIVECEDVLHLSLSVDN